MKGWIYDTDIGKVSIGEEGGAIVWLGLPGTPLPKDFAKEETELVQRAARQLAEYLSGERREFDLPLSPGGTEFMRQVYDALRTIPYGKTAAYGEIARQVGRPKAYRAVGLANNRNPIPIFIPCHRVVGASGALVGYGGGLPLKKRLLALEEG